jgi:DNA-binding transcriptional MocR family regulator
MESCSTPQQIEVPKYQSVANQIADMIDTGVFAPGTRIPSLRRLAKQMSVSLTTAMEAYRVIEDRGLVEARPQSGFYVRSRQPLPPSPGKSAGANRAVDPDISDLYVRMMRQIGDPRYIALGAGVPNPTFLPTEALNRILAREVRLHPDTSQSYDEGLGYPDLRAQISRRALDAGCTLSPDRIVTTNGAQQAIYLSLLAVTRPGDTVITESPTYVGLLQVLEALGLKALEVATDPEEGICLDCLAGMLERESVAACVLVPTFVNPLGHCMPEEKREKLVAVLADAEVPIIEDDVYGELYFDRRRPRSIKSFDRDGNVMLCSSFSKILAPGYRVGWVAPGRYLDRVERNKYILNVACPTPTQMAMASYLASGGVDRHLRRLRGIYRGLVARMSCAVAEHFPEGTKMTRPRGGHLLWVELPAGVDSIKLYDRALQHGVTFVPGPLFSSCCDYDNFIRLNTAVPWSDAVEGAIRTLGDLVREQIRNGAAAVRAAG